MGFLINGVLVVYVGLHDSYCDLHKKIGYMATTAFMVDGILLFVDSVFLYFKEIKE